MLCVRVKKTGPQAFAAFLKAAHAKRGGIARAAGLKVE